ncbi:hypothetical protein [Chryseobacterium sp. MA9]|uniref:tetratricopeptide repeat protein n=1 Tax=Chryseobacterium sp. MA9 TaxID=2966625 RepID=UPI002106C51D|nr:hypothetical protein [Chryseobacterium sp. MA9]UTX48905.1 hypothetical protein KIK00_01150 [Chryseobacterium sp. MA9]
MAMIYTNVGNILLMFGKYKESLHYLDKAKDKIGKNKNPLLNARLYNEYGKNYTKLGLFKQSNAAFDKAVQNIKKIANEKQKIFYLASNYSWKRSNFLELHQIDSLRNIEQKYLNLKSGVIAYTRRADYFIAHKMHLDSAEYYLNKALSSPDKTFIYDKAITLFSYGDLYTVKKEHEKALEYYFSSLEIFKKTKTANAIKITYDSIFGAYKALNNIEKSNEYLRKYTALNDSLNKQEKEAVAIVLDRLLLEEKKEKDQEKNKLYLLISIITISSLILLYFIRKAYISNQKKKDQLIEKQSKKLEVQVSKSFDQLTELAASGSPFFLMRFKEIYPEFYESLLLYNSDLTDYDLKLCAYIRMSLTTKEIAKYDNISLRTTETRKYRLKKKLELSQETDLNKWILDL